MLSRKSFLKRLGALPLLALAAPALSSIAQPATTYVAQFDTTLPEAENAAQEAQPVWTAYASEDAGDWVGYLESPDKSWITWVDKFGRVSAWARNLDTGALTRRAEWSRFSR